MQIEINLAVTAKRVVFLLITVTLLLICNFTFCQEYTAADSASFRELLIKSQSDFDRINYQLKLAEYSIRKTGSFKFDLDNARKLIDQSKKLNLRLKSKKADGHILLEEVYFQQESGSFPSGKAMCEQAIVLLKNGRDKYLLGCAYQVLAYYYGPGVHNEWRTKINLIEQSVNQFRESGNKIKTAAKLLRVAVG